MTTPNWWYPCRGQQPVDSKGTRSHSSRGTTPIARSLERTAADFPAEDARKVIVLITDGIEACDEDPCAVSRMLQEEGIVVKPFIIGIGLEEEYKDTFRCVETFRRSDLLRLKRCWTLSSSRRWIPPSRWI